MHYTHNTYNSHDNTYNSHIAAGEAADARGARVDHAPQAQGHTAINYY